MMYDQVMVVSVNVKIQKKGIKIEASKGFDLPITLLEVSVGEIGIYD
jgi:hypothetical protein